MDALIYFGADLLRSHLGCRFIDPRDEIEFTGIVMHQKRARRDTELYRQMAGAYRDAPRCALYRHFDAAGVLLYIGISNDLVARTAQHARAALWARFVDETTAEWHASRHDAELAEVDAIREERPLFNALHNEAVSSQERVRYLIDHGAWDMLDPRARPA